MSRGDWFQREFGFSEHGLGLDGVRKMFTLDSTTNVLTSVDKPDRPFFAGFFECPNLAELRERVAKVLADPEVKKNLEGKFVVREFVGDVTGLHVEPENKFALFQAASQFNCLEFPSQSGTPEMGITCYSRDRTQGPACAISCGPGTVVRNYFGTTADGKDVMVAGPRGQAQPQRRDLQHNNLSEIEVILENAKKKYFKVENGYTMATDTSLRELGALLEFGHLQEKLAQSLRIGMQWDTEVTSSAFGGKVYSGETQLVTQAYCSGCSVSYSRCSAAAWAPFASLVLDACYEATMLAAILNAARHPNEPGARRVFLTAIGGGVFGNDMKWIEVAMQKAFKKVGNFKLEVILVSYGFPTSEFQSLLT
jgi:hypothetical protein